MTKTLVTRIVKDSILDGPGCRYVVFVKGCHLRCSWCHNPETQLLTQEVYYNPQLCIKCGKCLDKAPPTHRSSLMPIVVDYKKIDQYQESIKVCPTNALDFVARECSADEIITDIDKYKTVYLETNGGITISGGEPLLVSDFVFDVLQQAKAINIHTAIDTTMTLPWEIITKLIPVVDLWLIDIKHPTDKTTLIATAVDNLLKLSKQKSAHVWIRIPIVPHYNDTPKVWRDIASLIKPIENIIEFIDLLPFHPYGATKYKELNMSYEYEQEKPLDSSVLNNAREVFMHYFPVKKIRFGREMVSG